MEPQEASTCLLPLFVIHMWCYHHGSQRATGDVSWWQDIFILFSSTGSGFCPRFTGAELDLWEFSHHCKSHYKSLQWWENSHRYSSAPVNLGQNPDPVPEKSINILHQPHTLTLQEPSLPSTYPHKKKIVWDLPLIQMVWMWNLLYTPWCNTDTRQEKG